MSVCFPPEVAEKLTKAVLDRRLVNSELMNVSADARISLFKEIAGEKYGEKINVAYETKLLLKDQTQALQRAVKAGVKDSKQRDMMLSRIENMSEVLDKSGRDNFYKGIAEKKLGYGVTFEEANALTQLSKVTRDLGSKLDALEKSNASPKEIKKAEKEYGNTYVILHEYVNGLKQKPRGIKNYWKDRIDNKDVLKVAGDTIKIVGGTTKGMAATFDLSIALRQGYKMMTRHPIIWGKAVAESPVLLVKELLNFSELTSKDGKRYNSAMHNVSARIASMKESRNGDFARAKIELGQMREEATPDTILNKLPEVYNKATKDIKGAKGTAIRAVTFPIKVGAVGISNVYRGFETAFVGTTYLMRADYGKWALENAKKNGVDIKNKGEAEKVGIIVNEMTGRGHMEMSAKHAEFTNLTLFSIRFWKSNVDFLTAHAYDLYRGKYEPSPGLTWARKEAALNLASTVASTAGIMYTAMQIWGEDAVEWDPRSSTFTGIRINNSRFNYSGGLSSHMVLAARIATREYKNSKTGVISALDEGSYFLNTNTIIANYFSNKKSPLLNMTAARLKGEFYDGTDFTWKEAMIQSGTPISLQTYQEAMEDPKSAALEAIILAETLGIGVNTY